MSDTLPTPVWDTPPSTAGRGATIDWRPTLKFLAEKPGEWARIDGPHPVYPSTAKARKPTSKANARQASLRKFGEGRIDTRVRTVEEDGQKVQYLWARLKTARP